MNLPKRPSFKKPCAFVWIFLPFELLHIHIHDSFSNVYNVHTELLHNYLYKSYETPSLFLFYLKYGNKHKKINHCTALAQRTSTTRMKHTLDFHRCQPLMRFVLFRFFLFFFFLEFHRSTISLEKKN